jgi:hypothetical protein
MIQHSTVRYGTVQYSTVQYSTVQYSTVQYSTVQYSTVQYSIYAHSCQSRHTVHTVIETAWNRVVTDTSDTITGPVGRETEESGEKLSHYL